MSKDSNSIHKKTYSYISTDGSGIGMVVVPLTELYEPKALEEQNGVIFRRVEELHVDVSKIPDHVRDSLAKATLEAFQRWLKETENAK